ncbi:MAG: hypothetical protein WCT37_03030 [Patescibacteria group bacterium]|jgi:hypothetical protein
MLKKRVTINDVYGLSREAVKTSQEAAKISKLALKTSRESFEVGQEILEAIGEFSNKMDGELGVIKSDITHIKATMVTKDYLDHKMAEQKGDLTVLIRKEDSKLKTVVSKLTAKKVFSPTDRAEVFALEPFPETMK